VRVSEKASAVVHRVRGWLSGLPLIALLALGILIVAGSSAGGYYAYKTYDYVQHDNEFCFSCHLMQDPYELFAESAHRGMGCKACHQPTLIERSMMGATGVLRNPDVISVHAEVPNKLCADCHVNGDPEKWALVANSAGHRIHFESEDPALDGLKCVECHQSSLHQFTASDETCAQSGCHTDSDVQLGAMSDLTMHCAACHGFNARADDLEAASAAIAPDQTTCLSCHAMRVLLELPEDDPHEGACASCHNPHAQETPGEAVQSCSTSACHQDPASLTPFHEGLDEAVAVDCLYCHQAHDFHVDGANCVACHQDILDDDPGVARRSAESPHGPAGGNLALEPVRSVRPEMPVRASGASALQPGASALHSWGYPIPQELDFLHSQHRAAQCADCHESTERHGQTTVTTVTDCRSCHHSEETVAADGCATCHTSEATPSASFELTRTLALSTGGTATRALPFEHVVHEGLDCASCHTEGLEMSASQVDCASCHEEHHEPEASCVSCHVTQADAPHEIETAHVTCSGAGCHQDLPFEGLPRTRSVCTVCHQDQVDHRVEGGNCVECHVMPDVG
jgi:nitrate/TMAO reductase-like tetraheme cytochrome c subunit